MSAAYSSAYVAVTYVTDPARWPGFAAFLEQSSDLGVWTEQDRLGMAEDGRIIGAIARAIDPDNSNDEH